MFGEIRGGLALEALEKQVIVLSAGQHDGSEARPNEEGENQGRGRSDKVPLVSADLRRSA